MPDQCDNCKYVRSHTAGEVTQYSCHKHVPPWPVCRADDWCGEYEAAVATIKAPEYPIDHPAPGDLGSVPL